MGYVMDYLFTTKNAQSAVEFQAGLQAFKGKTAWTSGVWDFGLDNQRPAPSALGTRFKMCRRIICGVESVFSAGGEAEFL